MTGNERSPASPEQTAVEANQATVDAFFEPHMEGLSYELKQPNVAVFVVRSKLNRMDKTRARINGVIAEQSVETPVDEVFIREMWEFFRLSDSYKIHTKQELPEYFEEYAVAKVISDLSARNMPLAEAA